jgi:hypothetical protein
MTHEMVYEWDSHTEMNVATYICFERLQGCRAIFDHCFYCCCPGCEFIVWKDDQKLSEIDEPTKNCFCLL